MYLKLHVHTLSYKIPYLISTCRIQPNKTKCKKKIPLTWGRLNFFHLAHWGTLTVKDIVEI